MKKALIGALTDLEASSRVSISQDERTVKIMLPSSVPTAEVQAVFNTLGLSLVQKAKEADLEFSERSLIPSGIPDTFPDVSHYSQDPFGQAQYAADKEQWIQDHPAEYELMIASPSEN